MRLLWASNAPWAPTGYGGQTALMVRRLKAAGHDIAIAANYGMAGTVLQWEGVQILPQSADAYGNDILPAHFAAWSRGEPSWLITLYDVWPYQRKNFRELPIASWVPVDHYPVPPMVAEWCREHETISMTRFGQDTLAAAGIRSTYIPHLVDRSVFYPRDRAEARALVRWPEERFVVLINAANKGAYPPRKAWNEMFGALAVFMGRHPDAMLHLHSEATGFQSVDLMALAGAWKLDPNRVVWSQPYRYKIGGFSPDELASFYSGADVLLATSMGEGFGLPVIEAQACGLPVIVSDFTAQPELVGGGWKADVQPWWDGAQNAFFGIPLITSILARLEDAYDARSDQGIRDKAIAKATEYDADAVFADLWTPYLAELEDKMKPRLSRRERRARKAA